MRPGQGCKKADDGRNFACPYPLPHGRHGMEEENKENEENESVFQGPCIPCVPWTIVRTIPPSAPEGMSGPIFMPGPFFLLSTAAPTRSPV